MSERIVLAACGMAIGVAGMASAQPFHVNGSGSGRLFDVIDRPPWTLDFIDLENPADCEFPDQLAPEGCVPPFDNSQLWQHSFRIIDARTGFRELRDWGFTFATQPESFGELPVAPVFRAYCNRLTFIDNGDTMGESNGLNPGGMPTRVLTNGSYLAVPFDGPGTGVQIDFALVDAPALWMVREPGGAAFPDLVPGEDGYGINPRTAVNKLGAPLGQQNLLVSVGGINGPVNFKRNSPDAFTVYDSPIAIEPIGIMTNLGTGMQSIALSDLRHLMVAGRRLNGENLMMVTRDAESSVRIAASVTACADPSWTVGENIGSVIFNSAADLIGPNFQPTNKGDASRLEATVFNHRLAVGYTPAVRGATQGWLTGGEPRAELLAVRSDLKGGVTPVRPRLGAVLDGGINGYNVVSVMSLATIGDPRSAPEFDGGLGMIEPFRDTNGNCMYDPIVDPFFDINGNNMRDAVEPRPGGLPPTMRNPQAASFVNNILRSLQALTVAPGGQPQTPGELLAGKFLAPQGVSNVPDPSPTTGCVLPVPSPQFVPTLQGAYQSQMAGSSIIVLAAPAYQTFDVNATGFVPRRTDGVLYGDDAGGEQYVTVGAQPINYGDPLPARNRLCADFNGDGARDITDATEMIFAWGQRNGFGVWNAPDGPSGEPGDEAIIEVLGDYQGDGRFDAEDVRYWADGLAIEVSGPNAGRLDRRAGFTKVDESFDALAGSDNFFGTALATGASYAPGDSAGDVSNELISQGVREVTRGFAPSGADGIVDLHDIDYICANFGDWVNVRDAAVMDLSCDMNADLLVDQNDVFLLVTEILKTSIGDVNLDGVLDTTDLLIILGNLGEQGAFGDGDLNCDGMVDEGDIFLLAVSKGVDLNGDGVVDVQDLLIFLAWWFDGCCLADINYDCAAEEYNCGMGGDCDCSCPGCVDITDLLDFLACWFNES